MANLDPASIFAPVAGMTRAQLGDSICEGIAFASALFDVVRGTRLRDVHDVTPEFIGFLGFRIMQSLEEKFDAIHERLPA